MCGISGIIKFENSPIEPLLLTQMSNTQKHRGPDESGIKIFNNIGLAHCRLSIIDLQKGTQPMPNEDETIWITFNGEIYNFLELRNELKTLGHFFKTNTDTEVIIHLYEEYGKNAIARLDGMFAFAVYDSRKNIIILARDRFGKKPLFYTKTSQTFIFSSELQALMINNKVKREINLQGLSDYFSLGYIPNENTIYNNVYKLLPSHFLEINTITGKIQTNKYWNFTFGNKIKISFEEARQHIRYLLENAVKKRLISDVPIGAFLSGGIDSTVVSGIMSKLSDNKIKTFSIGFDEKKFDERHYANIAATSFQSEHYVKVVSPDDFSILESLIANYGEPYADSSMIPTYLLCKFAKEKITVALTGDGGDEVFAGYYRYLLYKYSAIMDYIPLKLKKHFFNLINTILPNADEKSLMGQIRRINNIFASDKTNRYLNILSGNNDKLKKAIFGEIFKGNLLLDSNTYFTNILNKSSATNLIEQAMEMDINLYLTYDILTKIDTASMANSLELRSPLLDYQLFEFTTQLPVEYKLYKGVRKHILKEACIDIIPKELLNRNKMGFSIPIANWLRTNWKETVFDLFINSKAAADGYLNRAAILKILEHHTQSKKDYSSFMFSIIMFELWHRIFK